MRNDSLGLFWYDEPTIKKAKTEKPKKKIPEPIWTYPDYEPGIEEVISTKYSLITDSELVALPDDSIFFFDIESYVNYFLIAFKEKVSKKYLLFEMLEDDYIDIPKLEWVLTHFLHAGFNSNNFDVPLANIACNPKFSNCQALKNATNQIIQGRVRPHQILQQHKTKALPMNTVDLKELLPGNGSLKVYAARMHAPKIQDLPFPHDSVLSYNQKLITRHYCTNDLLDTELAYNEVKESIDLRVNLADKYKVSADLRSKSDTQCGNVIIKELVTKRIGRRINVPKFDIGTVFKFYKPDYIQFQTPLLNHVLNVVINENYTLQLTKNDGAKIRLPKSITELPIIINNTQYQMGLGGLHSKEKQIHHTVADNHIIRDRDVRSYYPDIVLKNKLSPEHLGQYFLDEFDNLVFDRLAAKDRGDDKTAATLKITINGAGFGNFGNEHSFVYSPQRLIQTTLTGQLSLLMLIEMCELSGISVVSANTDGIVIYTHKDNEELFNNIIGYWENATKFQTEETRYKAIYSRDVNNYIALPEKGKPKLKGAFRLKSLDKNPVNEICIKAVVDYLSCGASIEQTVTTCDDIRMFLAARKVENGAYKDGVYLGTVIRWYKSTDCPGPIIIATNANDVPLTDGCRPLQVLPVEFPTDVDFDWYIEDAYKILRKNFNLDV